jgi:hypothetical protein
MKTSYFGNKTASSDPGAVSIARWSPKWWGDKRRYLSLAPSPSLLGRSKAGLPWQSYIEEYKREVLGKLDPEKVYEDLKDSIILCWEKPEENCHRHLVAEWIEKALGVKVIEL